MEYFWKSSFALSTEISSAKALKDIKAKRMYRNNGSSPLNYTVC